MQHAGLCADVWLCCSGTVGVQMILSDALDRQVSL